MFWLSRNDELQMAAMRFVVTVGDMRPVSGAGGLQDLCGKPPAAPTPALGGLARGPAQSC